MKRYDTFDQLLGYCRNSANPVGRLVLYLFECFDAERAALSDEVCTGLQLANFWQDVARDFAIGRVYLPAEDRARFGYTDDDLAARRFTPAFRELMRFEVERTRGLLRPRGGAAAAAAARGAGGRGPVHRAAAGRSCGAIERQGYDVWTRRPEVRKGEKLRLLLGAAWRWWVG